jgi:5-methylcytosine-specific restriction endonuclease McrA
MSIRKKIGPLLDKYGNRCCICGEPMVLCDRKASGLSKKQFRAQRVTVEHVLDRARGGSNRAENLRLAHHRCNSGVSHLSPLEKFARYQPWSAIDAIRDRLATLPVELIDQP